MKKPALYKRMSKYKAKKAVIEFPIQSKKEIEGILKTRGYVEHSSWWIKGFVKVFILNSFLQIEHDCNGNKGVKCFYDKDVFLEFLRYFEYKFI